MSRTDSDTIKVRPRMEDGSQFKGSFFVHVEYAVCKGIREKPVSIGFSCQGKHGNTDIGRTIIALNQRVRLTGGIVVLRRTRSRKKVLSDKHPIVKHLLKTARATIDSAMTAQEIARGE